MFPYGQLDKNNEWVKLADLVLWDEAEEVYAKQFVNNYNGPVISDHGSKKYREHGKIQ